MTPEVLVASGFPDKSRAAVVIVAVYMVLGRRALVGLNIPVEPTQTTLPATGVVPWVSVKAAEVNASGFIASVNVAERNVLIGALVAVVALLILYGIYKLFALLKNEEK